MGLFGGIGSGSLLGSGLGAGIGFLVGGPVGAGVGAGIGGQFGANYDNNKAIDDQNQFNLNLWRMQQEYNTPANQVARLRAAGLNPNLFYSQGNPGNATSVPTMQAHSYNTMKFMDSLVMASQIENMFEQNKNLQAQNRNINADTRLKYSTEKRNKVESEYKQAVLDFYRKYGRWPDQSIASTITQTAQDLSGLNSHNIEFARENFISDLFRGDSRRPETMSRGEIYDKIDRGFVFDRDKGRWVKTR